MESKKFTALDYACMASGTIMRKYAPEKLPPEQHFHYHQGVFLSGVSQIYQLTYDQNLLDYIKCWVDQFVDNKGNVINADLNQLDDLQPGILFYFLWEVTNDIKYKKALKVLMNNLKKIPRNKEGGYWHKTIFPNQMWLDGLYMIGPLEAQYGYLTHEPFWQDDALLQVKLIMAGTRDYKTGLWYHAWDASKKALWANKENGHSPEFWSRAIGWVLIALLDELKFLTNHGYRRFYKETIRSLLAAVVQYQSKNGRWYQIINRVDDSDNWLENSASSLIVCALYRAVDEGILTHNFIEKADRGYQALVDDIYFNKNNNLVLDNICIGTGVGNYQHYFHRPKTKNDLHGMGAFILMCAAKTRHEQSHQS